jgi:RimJ/RimL family protein N-acetyltransferase
MTADGAVVLREVVEDDLPIFFEHQRDPEGARMAAFTPRDREAFMAHWTTKVLGDPAAMAWTVVLDGDVAGNVVSWIQDGRRLVGYWIGREHWGKGVATRGLTAFLDLVPTRPLYAYVATSNAASIRVLEKCGFVRTGEDPGPAEDGIEELIMAIGAAAPAG